MKSTTGRVQGLNGNTTSQSGMFPNNDMIVSSIPPPSGAGSFAPPSGASSGLVFANTTGRRTGTGRSDSSLPPWPGQPQGFPPNTSLTPGMMQPGPTMVTPRQLTSTTNSNSVMVVSTPPQSSPQNTTGYPNSTYPSSPAYSAASRAASDMTNSNPSQYGTPGASNSSVPMSSRSSGLGYGVGMGDKSSIAWAALLVLVIAVVGVTIAITVVASNQSPDVSSHMIVRTGHRTRDWSSGNSYSMNSLDDNHLTRLYVCMKAAGIRVPNDPNIDTFNEYKTAAKSFHDCGPKSDRGWPRDIGFLRCIQKHFIANFHQSNIFLKCLDLSEGASAESIQTPASMLFLGSYNFVTMLLTCMGVITAFLIFTAGGYFTSVDVFEMHGHISATHYWSPLSWIPTMLALLWSFSMWVTVMIYAFPPSNMWSDAPNDSGNSLPGTPWTGFMCSVVVFGLFVFFISCLGEWMDDYAMKRGGHSKKFDLPVLHDGDPVKEMGGPQADDNSTVMSNSSSAAGSARFSPAGVNSNPQLVGIAGRFLRAPSLPNLIRAGRSGYGRIPIRLGTKYNYDLHCTGSDVTRIAAPLNKTFALTWVFADGLMFLGMLNNQNSLLNENVVTMWYYITLCRGYQLTASFFMDDVLFINVDPNGGSPATQNSSTDDSGFDSLKKGGEDTRKNKEIKAHASIAVACSHFASLWCMITVAYHFINAISVASNLNYIGVSNPTYLLQIFFIVFILVMDFFKHVIAFATIFNQVTQDWYLPIIESTFTVDWVVRSVFIIATIFSVPHSLSDANQSLRSTILLASS